ncbi:MAG: hypothetical protein VX278_22065 [Myxococcota bacterium]|nr:hypothetical protein [Myxococcota bacterium]
MWRFIPPIFLFGCPVEPKDVQDQQEQQLPMQGDNMPPADGSMRPNNQQGNNQQGNMQQGNMQQGNMQQGNMQQGGTQGEQGDLGGGLVEDPNDPNAGQGIPEGMIQNAEDPGVAQNPGAAQDILPIYDNPPSFAELIEANNSIDINLTINGAESYNMEFVIAQENNGRMAPKVVHIEKSSVPKITIQAPKDFDSPVWLIITADVGADGPTKDDLFGGTKDPLQIGAENLDLEYTLVNDDSWLENLPWFSKVDNPASKKEGEPTGTEGN